MSEPTPVTEGHKYTPMLLEIEAAFRAVFPDERIIDVEYTRPGDYEVFAIRTAKKVRRYLRSDVARSFEDILRGTPELPPDKNE